MNTEPKNDPAKKLRKLLGSSSPMKRLPKKTDASASPIPTYTENDKTSATPAVRLNSPQARLKPGSASNEVNLNSRVSFFGPPFWSIASVLSLTINVILIIVMLVLAVGLKRYGLNVTTMLNLGSGLLGGLYSNFEKMDKASIATNVEVNTTIPVKFDLQLNQQTNVVLSQNVTIDNAVVTVKTGGLNITNAITTIVLPQGTILPVVLNLTVPVNTTVPIVLNVPVNIPLNKTELHEPFTGLQDVIKPFYCMLNNAAVNLSGESICK